VLLQLAEDRADATAYTRTMGKNKGKKGKGKKPPKPRQPSPPPPPQPTLPDDPDERRRVVMARVAAAQQQPSSPQPAQAAAAAQPPTAAARPRSPNHAEADEVMSSARLALAKEQYGRCNELCLRGLALPSSSKPGRGGQPEHTAGQGHIHSYDEVLRDLMEEAAAVAACEGLMEHGRHALDGELWREAKGAFEQAIAAGGKHIDGDDLDEATVGIELADTKLAAAPVAAAPVAAAPVAAAPVAAAAPETPVKLTAAPVAAAAPETPVKLTADGEAAAAALLTPLTEAETLTFESYAAAIATPSPSPSAASESTLRSATAGATVDATIASALDAIDTSVEISLHGTQSASYKAAVDAQLVQDSPIRSADEQRRLRAKAAAQDARGLEAILGSLAQQLSGERGEENMAAADAAGLWKPVDLTAWNAAVDAGPAASSPLEAPLPSPVTFEKQEKVARRSRFLSEHQPREGSGTVLRNTKRPNQGPSGGGDGSPAPPPSPDQLPEPSATPTRQLDMSGSPAAAAAPAPEAAAAPALAAGGGGGGGDDARGLEAILGSLATQVREGGEETMAAADAAELWQPIDLTAWNAAASAGAPEAAQPAAAQAVRFTGQAPPARTAADAAEEWLAGVGLSRFSAALRRRGVDSCEKLRTCGHGTMVAVRMDMDCRKRMIVRQEQERGDDGEADAAGADAGAPSDKGMGGGAGGEFELPWLPWPQPHNADRRLWVRKQWPWWVVGVGVAAVVSAGSTPWRLDARAMRQ